MPLYEYRCERCGNVIEVLQKFSDAPLQTHEECGGHLEKLISQSAFQLKGSGWYATDYPARAGVSKTEKTESKVESTASTETKTETKTESKTETKTESKPAAPAKSDT